MSCRWIDWRAVVVRPLHLVTETLRGFYDLHLPS
jgi:hypothetical protein